MLSLQLHAPPFHPPSFNKILSILSSNLPPHHRIQQLPSNSKISSGKWRTPTNVAFWWRVGMPNITWQSVDERFHSARITIGTEKDITFPTLNEIINHEIIKKKKTTVRFGHDLNNFSVNPRPVSWATSNLTYVMNTEKQVLTWRLLLSVYPYEKVSGVGLSFFCYIRVLFQLWTWRSLQSAPSHFTVFWTDTRCC